jgi:hypothetical protein
MQSKINQERKDYIENHDIELHLPDQSSDEIDTVNCADDFHF